MNLIYYAEAVKNLLPQNHLHQQCTMVGHTGYIPTDKYVFKLSLHKHSTSKLDNYTGIRISVLDRKHGELDNVVLQFPEYTSENQYTLTKCLCVVCNSAHQVYWDVELSDTEKGLIQHHIQQYINLWQGEA